MGNIRAHNMKVQYQFACGLWEEHEPSSLTFDCKSLCPRIDPKFQPDPENNVATFNLKSFIQPAESCPKKLGSSTNHKKESMERQQQAVGGTRWNPTQEQISILEMLYRGGMRTPNAQQIEEISGQLSKYGKIEGKNVFYWFQNHKARERQKQKRNILCRNQSPTASASVTSTHLPAHQNFDLRVYYSNENEEEDSIFKRKCRSWTFNCLEEDKRYRREEEEEDRTLLLFPLHPESR